MNFMKFDYYSDAFNEMLCDAEEQDWRWLLSASDKSPSDIFYEAARTALTSSEASTVYVWGAKPRRPTREQIAEIFEAQIDALRAAVLEKCGGAFRPHSDALFAFEDFIGDLLRDHDPHLDIQVRVSINRARFMQVQGI